MNLRKAELERRRHALIEQSAWQRARLRADFTVMDDWVHWAQAVAQAARLALRLYRFSHRARER